MSQTRAIFHDAYRRLNSGKMFWIVLGLNLLAVGAFASLGVTERGYSFLGMEFGRGLSDWSDAGAFYKYIFSEVGLQWWLGFFAAVLALISTASVFPDFIKSGSIDLVLSKPIGRLRLFLTQYVAGLLFAALQVTVFTVGCFLVIGIRGGVWEPWLLLAIPLMVVFFSYLFSVCALLGVLTRSTIAALLLTLLLWTIIFGLDKFDEFLGYDLLWSEAQLRSATTESDRDYYRREVEGGRDVQGIFVAIKTFLPKTDETIALQDRLLVKLADLPPPESDQDSIKARFVRQRRKRSVGWVLGSSLAFEFVMLALGAWIFCRRDY